MEEGLATCGVGGAGAAQGRRRGGAGERRLWRSGCGTEGLLAAEFRRRRGESEGSVRDPSRGGLFRADGYSTGRIVSVGPVECEVTRVPLRRVWTGRIVPVRPVDFKFEFGIPPLISTGLSCMLDRSNMILATSAAVLACGLRLLLLTQYLQ